MSRKTLVLPLSFKAGDSGEFTGVANATNYVDGGGDRTVPGFARRDLTDRGPDRVLLYGHDTGYPPLGSVALAETRRGLEVTKGTLLLDVQRGRELHAFLKHAPHLMAMSIGYVTKKERFVGSVREIVEAEIFEVSLTPIPMNDRSTIDVDSVKGADLDALARSLRDLRHDIARDADPLAAVRDTFAAMRREAEIADVFRRVRLSI